MKAIEEVLLEGDHMRNSGERVRTSSTQMVVVSQVEEESVDEAGGGDEFK